MRSLASPDCRYTALLDVCCFPREQNAVPLGTFCESVQSKPAFEGFPLAALRQRARFAARVVLRRCAVPKRLQSKKSASSHPMRCCFEAWLSQPSSHIIHCEAGHTGHTVSSRSRTCRMKFIEVAPDCTMVCGVDTSPQARRIKAPLMLLKARGLCVAFAGPAKAGTRPVALQYSSI